MNALRLLPLALMLAGAAQAADPSTIPTADIKPDAVVRMTHEGYEPKSITIKSGDVVEWRNESDQAHTVTARPKGAKNPNDAILPKGAKPFGSAHLQKGEIYRHQFKEPGEYRYYCEAHQAMGMVAKVIVQPLK